MVDLVLEPEIAIYVQRKLEFLGSNKAKKIVAGLQEISKNKGHQPFRSFAEISSMLKEKRKNGSVSLISANKMLEIVDRWNY
ncbi:hypothetical protein ACKFKF_18580 [Phormidesmis sp. 146-12]